MDSCITGLTSHNVKATWHHFSLCVLQVMDEIPRLHRGLLTSWGITERHQDIRTSFLFRGGDSAAYVKNGSFFLLTQICHEKRSERGGISQIADVNDQRLAEEGYSKPASKWRRNLKRPQGLDGKRRTVSFMNWPKCCLCRRLSPLNWTKPP